MLDPQKREKQEKQLALVHLREEKIKQSLIDKPTNDAHYPSHLFKRLCNVDLSDRAVTLDIQFILFIAFRPVWRVELSAEIRPTRPVGSAPSDGYVSHARSDGPTFGHLHLRRGNYGPLVDQCGTRANQRHHHANPDLRRGQTRPESSLGCQSNGPHPST